MTQETISAVGRQVVPKVVLPVVAVVGIGVVLAGILALAFVVALGVSVSMWGIGVATGVGFGPVALVVVGVVSLVTILLAGFAGAL